MSDPKQDNKRLGPDSSDSLLIEVDITEWDTRRRPHSELVEELRAAARKRDEQKTNPPKENGEPGSP